MAKKMRVGLLVALISFLTQCERANNLARTEDMGTQKNDRMPAKADADDPLDLPIEAKVPGEYMKAFLAAYSAFKDDPLIREEKRNIENYQIEFRQRNDLIYVLLLAKRKAAETEIDGGESELGRDVIYTVKKKAFTIVERKFYK